MERKVSGITTKLILEYTRKIGGEGAVKELLAQIGDGLDLNYLTDERAWVSFEQKVRMFEAAQRILQDPEAPFRIGQSITQHEAGSAIKLSLKMLKTPTAVLKTIPEVCRTYSDILSVEVIHSNENEGVLRYYTTPGITPHITDCDYNRGLLSAIPTLFGGEPAKVEHPVCAVRGDASYCEYKVSWRRRACPDWMLPATGSAMGMLIHLVSCYPHQPGLDLGLLIQPLLGAASGFILGYLLEDRKRRAESVELMHRQNALLQKTNAQLIDDLETAYQVQRTLLPSHTPKIHGLDVAGRLFYARRIGGDFYDFIPKGDRLGVCISDVCGKGIQAALFTSILKNALWQGMYTSNRPKKLLAYIDQQVNSQLPDEMFITMACAITDVTRDRLVISSAGHEPPILYRACDRKASFIEARGVALGLLPMTMVGQDLISEEETDFVEGDVLMLYTDGALCRGSDTEAQREYLCRQLEVKAHLPAETIVNEIFNDLMYHTHGAKRDDLTLVVVKRTAKNFVPSN